MRKRTGAAVTFLVLAALASRAFGDPSPAPIFDTAPVFVPNENPPAAPLVPGTGFWHIAVPWHLSTSGGTSLDFPPAYVLDEPAWGKIDAEFRRLQDSETRLTAENKSMKTSLSGWQPGWYTLVGVIAGGVALGWYAHEHL